MLSNDKKFIKAIRLKVGKFIRGIRLENNLSQKEVAELIGRTSGWVSRVERGEASITVEQLIILLLKLNYRTFVINLKDYRGGIDERS